MDPDILAALAPTGVLRAALNMANTLLITGRTADGEPDGVAPGMAREIARRLGVGVTLIPYPSPGEVADAAAAGAWDIGLIGAEPSRAETIDFTPAYVEIEATYLVRADAPFRGVGDVDAEGVRIAVSGRSAYDLYLTRSLHRAELVRGQGVAGAVALFAERNLDAIAGLRPALIEQAARLPGTRLLDGGFTAVQQAIGTPKGRAAGGISYLRAFVADARESGLVAGLIERHGVAGRLSVARGG